MTPNVVTLNQRHRPRPLRPALLGFDVHTKHRGLAVRIANMHVDRMVYVPEMGGWHVWDGARWIFDTGEVQVRELIGDTIREAWLDVSVMPADDTKKAFVRDLQLCETKAGTFGALALTPEMPNMWVRADRLDADPWLLNTANGTLDLRTLELMPHHPGNYLTKITTGAYVPDSPAPRWNAFLERSLPDPEIRAYVARLFGYGLLGLVRHHVMPIFTGTGRNGKSTLIEAIQATMGDYYAAVSSNLLMSPERNRGSAASPDVMQLRGARVVTMMETTAGAALDAARVKNLTGGDTINARQLFQAQVNFTPTHLPIMVTNHLPDVPADDPALWERLSVIPFDIVIPDAERDVKLGEALALEANGILAWAVAGWCDYQERGGLEPPDAVSIRTAKYRHDSDHVAMWLTDCCVIEDPPNPYQITKISDLWESWETWAKNNRKPAGRRPDLVTALLAIPGVFEKRTMELRGITGIKISG